MTVHSDFLGMHDFVVADLGVDEPVTLMENNGTGFTDHASRAVVTGYKERDLVAGGSIQQGDLKVLVSATRFPKGLRDLERKDRIKIQGRPYSVIHFDKFSRNVGGIIAYEITVRGT